MSNNSIIEAGVRAFIEKKVHIDVLQVMERIADRVVLDMESIPIPVDTGNMQDGTGIALYHGDVLKKYIPAQMASVSNEGLWGTRQLESVISYGAMKFSNDYHLVLFSAMPYAGFNSGDGGEFFKVITRDVISVSMGILKSMNSK